MKRVVALLLIASVALFAAVAPQSDLKVNAGSPREALPQFVPTFAPTPIEDTNVRSLNINSTKAPLLAVDTNEVTIVYFEDFEDGAPGWVNFDASNDPLGKWHLDDMGTGDSLWWCGTYDGSDPIYLSNWLVALEVPEVVMAGPDSILSFDMTIACEGAGGEGEGWDGWDGGLVQVSNDSGATWTIMEPDSLPYNVTSLYSFGYIWGWGQGIPGWGGEFGGKVEVNLADYMGDAVIVRFIFASDGGYDGTDDGDLTGMYIDSVNVAGNAVFNGSTSDGLIQYPLNPLIGSFWTIENRTDSLPSSTHVLRNYDPSDTTYVRNEEAYFESPSITLPSEPETRIYCNFEFFADFSDGDAFPSVDYWRLEISPDDGGTWNAISNPTGDPDGSNYVYSHTILSWYDFQYVYGEACDLTMFANKTVKFRFYFHSDDDQPLGHGLMIDDFVVYTAADLPVPTGMAAAMNPSDDVVLTWDNRNNITEQMRSFLATTTDDCGVYYGPAYTFFGSDAYVGAGVGEEYSTGADSMMFTSLDFAGYPLTADSISIVLYGLDTGGTHMLYASDSFTPVKGMQSINISAEQIKWAGSFWVMMYWESAAKYPAFYLNTGPAGGTMLLWGGAMYGTTYATPVGATGSYGDITYSGLNYNVYRRVAGESTYELIAADLNATTVVDTSAEALVEYEYYVTAVSGAYESPLSDGSSIFVMPSDIEEQKYDDGEAEAHFDLAMDTMVVVKVTPSTYPAKLEALRFNALYTGDIYKVKIFMDVDGMPGDSWLLIEPPVTAIEGWNTFLPIDVLTATGSGIVLEEGESVWIGVKGATPGDYPAWLGADTDGYSGKATMQVPGGGWTSIASYLRCNPMIRGYFDTDIDITATDEIVPAEYALAQNYPNPFNPVTTIHFELEEAGMTMIDIFDITGRHVRTLANTNMSAGSYDLRFDASALSSGVYFYRLTSGNFTAVKKMSLLK
jgi:hypothetical protein